MTLLSPWWGKRIERHGPRGATVAGLFCCALVPALTVITRNFWVILISYIFSGGTAPGFQLGLFNDMLDNLPEENKSLYIGIYNLVMQISPLRRRAVYPHRYCRYDVFFKQHEAAGGDALPHPLRDTKKKGKYACLNAFEEGSADIIRRLFSYFGPFVPRGADIVYIFC